MPLNYSYTVTHTNVQNGTPINWALSGADLSDFVATSGFVNADGSNSTIITLQVNESSGNDGDRPFVLNVSFDGTPLTSPDATLSITLTDGVALGASFDDGASISINETDAARNVNFTTTGSASGTLYWNITTDLAGTTPATTADWSAINSGGTGVSFSSFAGTISIDANSDASSSEGNETFYLQLREGSDAGTILDTLTITVVDDSTSGASPNFAFDPNFVEHSATGASFITGDTVNSNITFGRDGTLTIAGSSLFGTLSETINPAVGSDNWTDGSGASFGDNYQLFVEVEDALGATFTKTDGDGNDAYSMSGTTAANSWTQDGLGTGWMQMNGDLNINCRQVRGGGSPGTQTNEDGSGNGAFVIVTIKEYSGTLGTGTTVLTKTFEHVVKTTSS